MNFAPSRTRIAVSYADPLVAIGLCTVLRQQVDLEVVNEDALPGDEPQAQVIVADYARGLQIAAQGRQRPRARHLPATRVLVITAQDREHEVRSALDAGVDGYIDLGCEVHELVQAVRHLARGSRYFCAIAAQRIADSLARSTLTARERQVLSLVATGRSNKGIALDLDISIGTVKAHVKAVLGKLEAATRTQAASIAVTRGLIEEPLLVR
ncbi:MAG TPA: response regulator transcription factor [Candidatus Aquabacterium excrementipullorum]|nr:response regulator transcription factor [Candidatus Aquabacterium excrementipullorum]